MGHDLGRMWHAAINRSPSENLRSLRAKVRRRFSHEATTELNAVVPDVRKEPVLGALAVSRLPDPCHVIGLLGSPSDVQPFRAVLSEAGIRPIEMAWNWEDTLDFSERTDALLVCKVPTNPDHWQALKKLREISPVRVIGIQELLLPFTPIQLAQSVLPYYRETSTLSAIAPFYLGREYFRPIDRLDQVLPLSGKSVIEFGPMDGCLTAGLVAAGVGRLVAVEARPENFIKTLIARHAFGWDNVELVMDDFHNADRTTYGTFDLVFAHGVYYHSVAPFLFFQNMLSLSNNIFLGGFCATDYLPDGPYQELRYEGREYRVKEHQESAEPVTGGINATGYYFSKDDLMRFFRDEGCDVVVLSDEPSEVTAGRYVRLLARRNLQ
jgi:hypothetical protein